MILDRKFVKEPNGENANEKKEECVTVVVRCRPLSEKEKAMNYWSVVEMWPDRGCIRIKNPTDDCKDKMFTFDGLYDWNSKQNDLYDEMVRPLVDSVLQGFNATIFAYGQTGTGKTYTMEGCKTSVRERGVIPKSFEQIFTHISRTVNVQYLIRASYLEIYQEEIRDLLDRDQNKKYELRENKNTGVYVKGLQSFVCKSVEEIEQVMSVGNCNRTIGATNMNEHSSRSHAIFIITVEMSELREEEGGKRLVKVGRLNLVDLAGSERQTKTGATGDRLKEASKINLSLSALGNVISALVEKSQHVPYRDSKLTRLLQDSLGGNSKTLMVANIGPANYNYDESLTTLRYANRAKNIQNQPRINEDPKDTLIRQYQDEIQRLKSLLTEKSFERGKKSKEDEEGLEEESQLRQTKADILSEEKISEEERGERLKLVEEKLKLIEEEKRSALQLAERIKSMESKLLQGGKNIADTTNERQKALEANMAEIREKKMQSMRMQKELEEAEESAQLVRISYANMLEEVEVKKKILGKILGKVQHVKQDISDAQEEHGQNRRDLELSQKEVRKDMKLRQVIIGNFVPSEEKEGVEGRLVFEEDDNTWKLLPDDGIYYVEGRMLADERFRKPTCEFAKRRMRDKNTRYKCENILWLDLDILKKSTKSYERPSIAASLKSMLEDALKNEEDLDIDASPRERISGRESRNMRNYPRPRGLVPR